MKGKVKMLPLARAPGEEAKFGEGKMDGTGTTKGQRYSWRYSKGIKGILGDKARAPNASLEALLPLGKHPHHNTWSNHLQWGLRCQIPCVNLSGILLLKFYLSVVKCRPGLRASESSFPETNQGIEDHPQL